MNKPTNNDITGDPIQTKASTRAYREGYDRIFARPAIKPTPSYITRNYTNIGAANGCTFERPPGGGWVRYAVSKCGNTEWYCNNELKQYYRVYCD